MTTDLGPARITALAPTPPPLDPDWSEATLARILREDRALPHPAAVRRRRTRRRTAIGLGLALPIIGAATAVAIGGPTEVVSSVIHDFARQPNTTGNGLGRLDEPALVAKFDTDHGVFAFWVATSSTGKVCYAMSDGVWDGTGTPTKQELEYGCDGVIWVGDDVPPQEVTAPDQLGGYFTDSEPLVYGISPWPTATQVRVQAPGVDRTLPVRADSHGYGAALPEAVGVPQVTLTFLDAAGQVVGTKVSVAPVG
ncbi:hypothetical protein [Nocardioides nitrophenolicus]|uniref:hypothetical protein n=1 Tax=Nocardioides nitrophenolicus TaxID=60489 RepID=UPI0019580FED|nr:hypothetical protein [Nocardioides nitrophenolicus]MBM7520374.1 hypothetical protein [Nocardioides nitrophenolicus]